MDMKNISIKLTLLLLIPLFANWVLTFFCVQNGLSVLIKPGTTIVILEVILSLVALIVGVIIRSFIKTSKPQLTVLWQNVLLSSALAILGSGFILAGLWSGAILGEFSIWAYIQDYYIQLTACIFAILQVIAGYFALSCHRIDDGDAAGAKSATA